jgi:hypothetical protein
MTPQRNAIVEHLEKVQYHPTARSSENGRVD